MTFADVTASYLAICDRSMSPSTLRGYRTRLEGIWVKAFGDKPVAAIGRRQIDEVIGRHTWTPKTFANALTPLRGVLDLALDYELVTRNPAATIKAPRAQPRTIDPLTGDEMHLVLDALPGDWSAYFLVAFGSGMRPSELMALKWSAIDEKRGTIHVGEARIAGVDKGTKTHEVREVPIMPMASRGIELARAVTYGSSAYVFQHPATGEPLHDEQAARRVWTHTLVEVGVRHRKAYSTRHTFATLLLMAGEPIERIASWLGYASPAMMYRHYAKRVEDKNSKPSAAALEALG